MEACSLTYRRTVRPDDPARIEQLVRSTNRFNEDEVAIARELLDDVLEKGERSDYEILIAEHDSVLVGYTCYGRIRGSEGRYEIYWIAVATERQGRGLGRLLLAETERLIRAEAGQRIYVETSSRAEYLPTQAFYEVQGYCRAAYLEGYYRDDDGLLVYVKRFD
jgi:ribosomal protein S18 acetylase RimI-like enzyme